VLGRPVRESPTARFERGSAALSPSECLCYHPATVGPGPDSRRVRQGILNKHLGDKPSVETCA